MTLLKCLRNGAAGEADILLVKASLDGVAAMAFAAGTNAVEHGGGLGGRATPRSEAAAPTGCSPSQPPDRRPGEHSPLVQFSSAVVGGLTALALALELLDLPAPSVGKAWPGLAWPWLRS